ncbi:Smr/MutS family protein [Chloroflexota bacterium]
MSSSEPEIMLRRLSVEDASIKLDKSLYNVYVAGEYSVRVVHGKGTGTLRSVVRQELKRHPLVESFRPAESWEGGAGVTVAQLISK